MDLTQDQIEYLQNVIKRKKQILEKRRQEVINNINGKFDALKVVDSALNAHASKRKQELIKQQGTAFKKALNKLSDIESQLSPS